MTIAELHGKLNPLRPQGVSERMEDLLTSDVFGTMKYAGSDNGFIDWIKKAEPAPIFPTAPPISTLFGAGGLSKVYYKFWPILKNGREPDLALLVVLEGRNSLLIVVEAKYFSALIFTFLLFWSNPSTSTSLARLTFKITFGILKQPSSDFVLPNFLIILGLNNITGPCPTSITIIFFKTPT